MTSTPGQERGSAAPENRLSGTLRKLLGMSLVYGVGSVLTRGFAFLLLPVYTRHLAPSDYAVVALCLSVVAILGVLFPLGLHGAVTRTYYQPGTSHERRERAGTLWVAMLAGGALLAFVLDQFGSGLMNLIAPAVPFQPYIRLAIWTAFLNIFGLVPLVLFQLQERPSAYVAATVGISLLTAGFILILVVGYGLGAHGYLLGALIGAGIAAGPLALITLRNVRPVLRWDVLGPALLYSLPLVPHAFASWALEMSDRALLTHFVSMEQLGVYSLGYQLGAAMGLVTAAFNNSWVPFLFQTLSTEGADGNRKLARVVSYFALVLCSIGLGWALLVKPAMGLIAGPGFSEAYRVTPYVVAGYVCNGLYLIPVSLLFWRERTGSIPLVTVGAAAVNVGLNLWLVPRYGVMAAAWTTALAYGVMLFLAWWSARRQYQFPYEYRRLGLTCGVAVALFLLARTPTYSTSELELAVSLGSLALYPVILLALGVVDRSEVAETIAFIKARVLPRWATET